MHWLKNQYGIKTILLVCIGIAPTCWLMAEVFTSSKKKKTVSVVTLKEQCAQDFVVALQERMVDLDVQVARLLHAKAQAQQQAIERLQELVTQEESFFSTAKKTELEAYQKKLATQHAHLAQAVQLTEQAVALVQQYASCVTCPAAHAGIMSQVVAQKK